ncbi:hypothetical protein [Erwinia aphidicola]
MMSASDLLKMKFHSDRQLALYSEAGLKYVIRSAQGVVSDVYSGMERASWYTSCLTERYADVCNELFTEERRMALSVKSIYKYRDVIQLMIMIYIQLILDDTESGNQKSKVKNVVKKVTSFLANKEVGKTTRLAMSLTLSKALAESQLLSNTVIGRVSKGMPYVIAFLQFYGIEQKAALAARKLKSLEPSFYWVLYELQIEMLYYFIEPVMNNLIKKIHLAGGQRLNQSDLLEIIRSEVSV